MRTLDPHMQIQMVRDLQSEMRQRAERHERSRSRRDPEQQPDRQRSRTVTWFIRRLRPAVQQEVR